MSSLRSFKGVAPKLGQRVYVDPAASVIGDVVLGDDVSIWPGSVLRGDVNHIHVGARSSIQDGSVVHVAHAGRYGPGIPCLIGEGVTIGHGAVVHACTIGNYCLIGMHATVMDGAVVHKHGFVGAGSLIAPGKVVGEGELWLGNPARLVRRLSDAQIEQLHYSADHYVRLKDAYLAVTCVEAPLPSGEGLG
ncbi:MAG TPA: gamma carbonic anhydrase family protein [Rhodanobacter sp.]|nr:gamma carbonic anhydrase family protein [Rhodanobacter sp.]